MTDINEMTNPLERYRKWADAQKSYDPESWDLMILLAQRIEELEGTNEILGQWVEDKDKSIAELEAEVDKAWGIIHEKSAENKRLRSALREIASHHMEAWGDEWQRGINFCADIARKATQETAFDNCRSKYGKALEELGDD